MIVMSDQAREELLRSAAAERQGSLRGIGEILRDVMLLHALAEQLPECSGSPVSQADNCDTARLA